jgi:hypothetical protein
VRVGCCEYSQSADGVEKETDMLMIVLMKAKMAYRGEIANGRRKRFGYQKKRSVLITDAYQSILE